MRLWAVADGMGGHAAGDVASRLVVDALANFAPHDHVSDSIDCLEDRLIDANRECLTMVENDAIHQGMGSTAAGSTVVEKNLDRITIILALIFGFCTLALALLLDT